MAKGIAKMPEKIRKISSSTFTPGLVPQEKVRTPLDRWMCHVTHRVALGWSAEVRRVSGCAVVCVAWFFKVGAARVECWRGRQDPQPFPRGPR
jgi:hypothetical protein